MQEDKIRLQSDKRPAPKIVPYILAVVYVVVAVMLIVIIKDVIKKDAHSALPLGIVLCITFALIFICSQVFSWERLAYIYKKNNKLIYEVYNIVDALGDSKTIYTIDEVTNFKEKGHKIVVEGSIEMKERFTKTKRLNRISINYHTPEVVKLLEEFKV